MRIYWFVLCTLYNVHCTVENKDMYHTLYNLLKIMFEVVTGLSLKQRKGVKNFQLSITNSQSAICKIKQKI